MTQEVKTRQTFEEWNRSSNRVNVASGSGLTDMLREVWNAALASVELPEGKRFEVGDEVEFQYSWEGKWVRGIILAADNDMHQRFPQCVRPLPTPVELTDDEKISLVATAIVKADMIGTALAYRKMTSALTNGKTLDELCQQYGIETTRRM